MKFQLTLTLVVFLIFSINITNAQKVSMDYTTVDETEMYKKHEEYISRQSYQFLYNNNQKTGVIREGIDFVKRLIKTDEQDENENREMFKLEKYKAQYSSFESYPEKIVDGWHYAVITDNMRFCKQVKVLVNGNKIKKFVIKDYLPIAVQAFTKIKKGKSSVNLEHLDNEESVPVDVYFLFDIEEPNLVEAPKSPALITFWTSIKKNHQFIIIKVDNEDIGGLPNTFKKTTPSCEEIGTISIVLEPGIHNFIALGRGHNAWKRTFEAKSGECLKIGLRK